MDDGLEYGIIQDQLARSDDLNLLNDANGQMIQIIPLKLKNEQIHEPGQLDFDQGKKNNANKLICTVASNTQLTISTSSIHKVVHRPLHSGPDPMSLFYQGIADPDEFLRLGLENDLELNSGASLPFGDQERGFEFPKSTGTEMDQIEMLVNESAMPEVDFRDLVRARDRGNS